MSHLQKDRINFILKTPNIKEKRQSFSILKQTIKPNGKKESKILKISVLDAINKRYKYSKDFNTCLMQAKEVRKDLYDEQQKKEVQIVWHQDNIKILDDYWKDEYEDRDIIDSNSAYNRLHRAITAVGNKSLVSTDKKTLQEQINKNNNGNKQREIISAINQLLKYLDRDFKLNKNRSTKHKIVYVTFDDFKENIDKIKDRRIKALHWIAITTGMRIGEIFAIRKENYHKNIINILGQIDRKQNQRETKNRRNRKAYILKEGRKWTKYWCELPEKDKLELRNRKISDITNFIFGVKFHDLRHSYAIKLISKGVSLSLVAQSLGNNITVCQEYYAGFTLSDEGIETVAKIVG